MCVWRSSVSSNLFSKEVYEIHNTKNFYFHIIFIILLFNFYWSFGCEQKSAKGWFTGLILYAQMLSLCWKYQSLSSPSPCAEEPWDVNLILHFINIKSEIVNKANSATKSYQNKNIFTPIALMHNNLHLWIYNENFYIF